MMRLHLTAEQADALDDALSYYVMSDYGHGNAQPEDRPEGAQEHRDAIDSIVSVLTQRA